MRECISIHIGQAGIQTGKFCFVAVVGPFPCMERLGPVALNAQRGKRQRGYVMGTRHISTARRLGNYLV